MKVISLFDGIATGRLALEQLGFQNIEYEAYEIEDFPIKVAKKNFPDIIEKGDVFKAEYRGVRLTDRRKSMHAVVKCKV